MKHRASCLYSISWVGPCSSCTQNTRLSTNCQKVVIIDHFWVVRVVTVMVPFLTTLRAKLGPKVVTLTTQKLSLGCHWDSAFFHLVPKLGYPGNNFLVVNADNFNNFLDDNHKAVLLTPILTTSWQPCVLCVVWYTNIQISENQYTSTTKWYLIYTFHGVEVNIQISNDQYTSLFNRQYMYMYIIQNMVLQGPMLYVHTVCVKHLI